jgi:hypothetical protein
MDVLTIARRQVDVGNWEYYTDGDVQHRDRARTFAYNSTTQFLASATNPENGMISYTYNADSTLFTKTYNNGNYQQYNYDPYQRLTEIQGFVYNSPQHYTEDTSERQTFTYDSLNGVPYPGLLTMATFASGLDTTNAWTAAKPIHLHVGGPGGHQGAVRIERGGNSLRPADDQLHLRRPGHADFHPVSESELVILRLRSGWAGAAHRADRQHQPHLGLGCAVQPGQPDDKRHLAIRH